MWAAGESALQPQRDQVYGRPSEELPELSIAMFPGNDFDGLVHAVLSGSQPGLLAALIARLPPYGMARIGSEAAFSSPTTAVRVIRLATILTELAYGVDPEFASGLGEAMLRVWPKEIDTLRFRSDWETNTIFLAVIRSTAQSHLLIGDFDRSVQLIDKWLRPERFRIYKEPYASTYLRKVEALAHQRKLSEAIAAFRELTREEVISAGDSDVVCEYIAPFLADALQPDQPDQF